MKKILASGIIAVSVLGVSACGDDTPKSTRSSWKVTTQANGNVDHYRCIGVSKLVKKSDTGKVIVVKGSKECGGQKP